MNTTCIRRNRSQTRTGADRASCFGIRLAAATVAVGVVTALGTGGAFALGVKPSIQITRPGPPLSVDGGIFGTVDVSSCPMVATVEVTDGAVSVAADLTLSSPGVWSYNVGSLPAGNAVVTPTAGGGCPFGSWSPASVSVYVPASTLVPAPEIEYVVPKVTTVDGNALAAGVASKFADLKLHLNDYGPQHGSTHQLANSSFVSTGSTYQTFNIPEASYNMKLCSYSFCPSLGHANFYVNNVNLQYATFSWTASGQLQMTVDFAPAGRGIKGFYSNGAVDDTDGLMPDAEILDASVTVALVPVADGAGGVSFVTAGPATFTGDIQATGSCSALGWDWCDALFGYKATIATAVDNAALSAIDSPGVQSDISANVRPILDQFGIGNVTGVEVAGTNVLIAE